MNHLRVQADNLDQPFDINQGAKLDLGSTAKLRTLITYLEIVAELHRRAGARRPRSRSSPPTRWTRSPHGRRAIWVSADRSLPAMLEAAMRRSYSASPWERFTGGGQHQFANFNPEHNDAR